MQIKAVGSLENSFKCRNRQNVGLKGCKRTLLWKHLPKYINHIVLSEERIILYLYILTKEKVGQMLGLL